MSILDRLSHLMNDSVSIAPRTGEENGTAKYGVFVTFSPCQVFKGPVRFRTEEGDLIIGNGQSIIAVTPLVKADAQIKFDDGELATIKYTKVFPDASGKAFQLVIF